MLVDKTRRQIRDRLLSRLRREPQIMGILNVTPDSFSDGGRYFAPPDALRRGLDLGLEGADIIDVGGESTRPGATAVEAGEETARIEELIASLARQNALPISVDTYKASVAAAAASAGAVIINDVWGMTRDEKMAQVVAETECLIVVTYNRGTADPEIDLASDMRNFFDRALETARAAGVPRRYVILDPGLGFAKTYEQNYEALARLDVLLEYDLPVLVGASRKSFIGRTLNRDVGDRLAGTIAVNLAALRKGADIIRVHDVAAHRDALTMLTAVERQ